MGPGHSLDLTSGIHDVCIALVDDVSGIEVGARTGIRLSVKCNAVTQSSNSSSLTAVASASVVVIAIFLAILYLIYRRRRRELSGIR